MLASMTVPKDHGPPMPSTNPLARLNQDMGRRAEVAGIFPHRMAALRRVGAVWREDQRRRGRLPAALLESGSDGHTPASGSGGVIGGGRGIADHIAPIITNPRRLIFHHLIRLYSMDKSRIGIPIGPSSVFPDP